MRPINNLIMKIFITLLFLTLGFQSWTKADDISDFQIEGMSIGENLIKHAETIGVSVNEIKSYNLFFYPRSKKYAGISFKDKGNFKTFDAVQFTINPNNYDIHTIGGKIYKNFENNMAACYRKQNEILNELKSSFSYEEIKFDSERPHNYDKTGKSTVQEYFIKFSTGEISIRCTDWTSKIGIADSLTLSILTNEHRKWLTDEAY